MLLLRLILIFLIAYIAISALKSLLKGGKSKLSTRQKSPVDGEEMVFDPQCRSYVPKSEALALSGQYFCSQECARIYLSR
jgi:hypothetical protein